MKNARQEDRNVAHQSFKIVSLGDGNKLRPALSFFQCARQNGLHMQIYAFDPNFDLNEVQEQLGPTGIEFKCAEHSLRFTSDNKIFYIVKGNVTDYYKHVPLDKKVDLFCMLEAVQFMDDDHVKALCDWAKAEMSESSTALVSAAEQIDSQHYLLSALSLAKAKGVGEIWPGPARALARAPQVGQCIGKLLEDMGFTTMRATLFRGEGLLSADALMVHGQKWLHDKQKTLLQEDDGVRVHKEVQGFGESMKLRYAVRLWEGSKTEAGTAEMEESQGEAINNVIHVVQSTDDRHNFEHVVDEHLVAKCKEFVQLRISRAKRSRSPFVEQ